MKLFCSDSFSAVLLARLFAGATLLVLLGATAACTAPTHTASGDPFVSVDIGNPPPIEGTTTTVKPGSDYDVLGYGRMFGLHWGSDMGRFVYMRKSGDFDISVRMEDVHPQNPSAAKAGLMIRRSLEPTDLFFSQEVDTNEFSYNCDQYCTIWRLKEGGALDIVDLVENDELRYKATGYTSGSCAGMPRPFPLVWLRITRKGNTYTAYKKEVDGDWIKMGENTFDLGSDPYIGMYIAPNEHGLDADNGCEAKFRDLAGF
jgi:hypothetical protein